jgi:hypothetical protein
MEWRGVERWIHAKTPRRGKTATKEFEPRIPRIPRKKKTFHRKDAKPEQTLCAIAALRLCVNNAAAIPATPRAKSCAAKSWG